MKRRLLFIVVLFSLIFDICFAKNIIDKNKFDYFIYDTQNVLSQESKDYINGINLDLKNKTGGEIAIVILDSIEEGQAKAYATEIFNELGIGEKGKDNGCLILMATKSRDIQIEPGYGAEGFITDAKCARIYRAMGQVIRESENSSDLDYEAGILEGFNNIIKLYEDEYDVELNAEEGKYSKDVSQSDDFSLTSPEFIILIIVIYIIFSFFINGPKNRKRRYRSNRFGGFDDFGSFGGFGGFGGFGSGSSGGFGGFGGGSSGGGGAGGKF